METGKILVEESHRLSRLVNDLFDLAQADEGRLHLEVERVAVSEVATQIVKRMHSSAAKKGISLQTDFERELWADVDVLRFEQIMVNLIDNALRHTPGDGRIRVWGDETEDGVVLAVDDSGPGLPQDGDKIWERFYRSDASRNRDSGGSGLGLSIVKSLVDLHGGDVFANNDSSLGGARVGFRLRKPS